MPPVLNIFGGKITTYRRLAEAALEKLAPFFGKPGDAVDGDGVAARRRFSGRRRRRAGRRARRARCPFLDRARAPRGSSAPTARGPRAARRGRRSARPISAERFGADLTEREVRYLMQHEWARTAEDVLWRRSKLGLRVSAAEAPRLDDWMQAASAARRAALGAGGRRRRR